jgi:hypothetical protein
MRVPTLPVLVAVATLTVSVSLPAQSGGFNWPPAGAIPKWDLGEHIRDAFEDGYKYKHGKFVKKTEQSTGYTIRYRSPNNPMEDNPCWTERKLAFHQYIAGNCVYDPDMYKSLIDETQPSSSCTKSTIDFDRIGHSWWYNKETSSTTSAGNCPTHSYSHGGPPS